MKKTLLAFAALFLLLQAAIQTEASGKAKDSYFDVDLTGFEQHSFGSFNQLGHTITPIAHLYFVILQLEKEWIDEPRLYTKGNKGYVHLWKKDGTNVLYKVEKQTSGLLKDIWEIKDVKRTKIDRIPVPKSLLKEVLIDRLLDPIGEAVEKQYGQSKLWFRGDEKILKIEKDSENYYFLVTVQIQTFEGPHNPPYGRDTMTFKIRGSEVELLDFKHETVPEEELAKLQFR
ncbi:hypothetical protein A8F94_15720 [Bacillus sp. FJAT-27225]|uniref:DUF3888 domain-containing protein n=1 Tax=Bacillus sp. FJAT-27225 TaxID=1743144 RepID=UPI00080C2D55|nr:DUF3888 domain-containing protein [Bacillus sp. FJAT-27225]OCA84168.1 hypothetical protein A8F94_15720 [Bacillus sp. FJAT-27225]